MAHTPVPVQPLGYSQRPVDAWRAMTSTICVAALVFGLALPLVVLTGYWPNLTGMRLPTIAWPFLYTDFAGAVGALALIPSAIGLHRARRWGAIAMMAAAGCVCVARAAHSVYGAWVNPTATGITWHLAAGALECLLPALLVYFALKHASAASDTPPS